MSSQNSLTMLIVGFRHHILALKRGEDVGSLCDDEKMLQYFDNVINDTLPKLNSLGGLLSFAGKEIKEWTIPGHTLEDYGSLITDLSGVLMMCKQLSDKDSEFSKYDRDMPANDKS